MKFVFGADLVPTPMSEPYFLACNLPALFGDTLPILQGADRFAVNLECALTAYDGAIEKHGPNLKAAPGCADALKAAGVTDVMLSNNHVFDFGIQGLRDTMANLDRVGLPYTGVGENDTDSRKIYYIEQEGKKLAIVNVCEHEYTYALPDRMGANPFDPFLTMHDVREAKKNADFVIVVYHGGKEYCRYPSPRLRLLCHELIECGADAVLTQHSHCIGCYEQHEGGHIVYGQGNFHFVREREDDEWCTSLIVELEITDKVDITFYPAVMTGTGIDLAKGERAEAILSGFRARNEELQNGKWREGWHAFCESQPYYRNVLKKIFTPEASDRERELFPHYLDCEAHTDVWRELFPTWNHRNEK